MNGKSGHVGLASVAAVPSQPDRLLIAPLSGESVFSSWEFVAASCRSADNGQRPLVLEVLGSGRPRTMSLVQAGQGRWGRTIPVTRVDFCASPAWQDALDLETVHSILRQLTTLRTHAFTWFVRFDHSPLADRLISLGIGFAHSETRIVPLESGYEKVFSGYSATLRNHVRKAERRGVTVRETYDPQDVASYYALYMQLVTKKGWTYVYRSSSPTARQAANGHAVFRRRARGSNRRGGDVFA